jgi:uncharacterized protein YjdB
MKRLKKIILSVLLSSSVLFLSFPNQSASAYTSDLFPFIILSQYEAALDIGDELYILAVTSNGKQASWKSSNSSVVSVNTYGIVTAKKAGTALITAKITNAEASCIVTVNKTKISIDKSIISIEHGEAVKLTAVTSNGSPVTWKSRKKSVATVDEYGKVTGLKPGETTISASADGSTTTCTVTVKLPTIRLNKSSITLFRGQSFQLSADVSSSVIPSWKTNKKSVAIVDATGTVTAIKHGSAVITATVDGVSKTCEIIVQKPDITLTANELTVKRGSKTSLMAIVSSGNLPTWSSSNTNIISVNSKGVITALSKGKAYIYASEDGTKVRCIVTVTD